MAIGLRVIDISMGNILILESLRPYFTAEA